MSQTVPHDLQRIISQFQVDGIVESGIPYGTGHINDTFAVTLADGHIRTRYLLQRVNHLIFRDVPNLMRNIQRVTGHILNKMGDRNAQEPGMETLTIISTVNGEPYHCDFDGNFWRTYVFIENAKTYDEVQSQDHAYQAAYAFGSFQKQLLDFPDPPLMETIPDFHHTPKRFEKLQWAIEADVSNRARTAALDIDFALAREGMTRTLVDLIDTGDLPVRVTHNDTKINNVMINDADGRGLCVIDLDTVMPGTVLYDFGDQIRTTTGTAPEDERDLSKVCFQLDMFDALVHGYLEAGRDFLAAEETQLLAFCGRLITFEIGIRFLTDYLEGDVYFKTHREGHNLDRARTQFQMVRHMEAAEAEMESIVRRYL